MAAAAPAVNDTSGDEDLARRLQQAEAGIRRPPAARVRPAPARHDNAGAVAQPHVQPGQFDLRLTSCFLTIYTIPQVAAAVVVLSAKENPTCDSALGLWVIVNSVRLMISLGIFWVLAIHQASQSRCLRPSARCAHAMYQPMMLVSWVWLVVGTLWVMGTDNCQTLAPELFDLSVAMVSMAFLWLFMPLVIFIVLVPFAICCSPFHRRLLRYLQVTQPTPPGRGAEPEQLERVPTTVYRKKRVEDGELLETACPVCFVDFSEGQQLRQPHCGHVVCDSCGKQWWSMNAGAAAVGMAVDCKSANSDCRACASMDYCKFVVTRSGAQQEASACLHWKDKERLVRLLGGLMMPPSTPGAAMLNDFAPSGLRLSGALSESSNLGSDGGRQLMVEYGGDWEAVWAARHALSVDYTSRGPSCPTEYPAEASWDIPSTEWEPVHGPGDLGTLAKSGGSDGDDAARFAQQGVRAGAEAAPPAAEDGGAAGKHSLRLNSDSAPVASARRRAAAAGLAVARG
ncbi:hypothetical protein FNF31_00143 [Cafeteria roenbergensis]|uniref:RING-type domain-containing protein n=1 Tax=Cafeteria roenbergensis TaxID=33653 RepID=A0A5A8DU16_CAFRO|nr:hypothetical protein FNF31_00143 [Cafeteria roenbergensis]